MISLSKSSSSIKAGAILSYLAVFLSIAITFFYTPWMIKKLGMSDYALYSLIVTFISYFILDFGLSGTVTRFVAKYRTENDTKKIENVLGLTFKAFLGIDSLIFVVLAIIYPFISDIFRGLTEDEIGKLRYLYIIAGGFSVLTFLFKPIQGAMMAFEYFIETKVVGMIHRLGTVLLIVLALMLGGGVYELVFINGLVGFVCSLTLYYIFKRKSGIKINFKYFEKSEIKNLLSFSMWVFLITLAQRFRLSFIPSLLGILSNSTQISIFALGMSIEGMVWLISSALNGLFLPKVTRLIHDDNQEQVLNLMIRVGRIQLFIITLIILGFIVMGRPFIHLWVGDHFEDTFYVVILLTITNIITLPQSVAGDVVYAENKVKYTASFIFISSGLALLFSILLAPAIGAIGCAIAFCGGMVVYIVLVNRFYNNRLKIDIKKYFYQCHFKIFPLLAGFSIVFFVLARYVQINSWIHFFVVGFFYTFTYLLLSYFFLFNQEEKKLIKSLLIKQR